MKYSLEQLQSLAASVGFPDPALAAAVAMAESGGNSCSQGDPNIGQHSCDAPNGTSQSFGLWQVNTPANPQYDATKLLDAQYNARAALAISRGGTYWHPWTTYRTGAYQRWYPFAVQPPGGGTPIIPTPVTPPAQQQSYVAAAVGVAALVAAVGYTVYELLASRKPDELEPFQRREEWRPRPRFRPQPQPFKPYGGV